MPKKSAIPKYTLHAPTGTARVRWTDSAGKRQQASLGKYGSSESRKKYAQLIARIQAESERPQQAAESPTVPSSVDTVGALAVAFRRSAVDGYSKSETAYYEAVTETLILTHGVTPVAEFGPRALAEVRAAFVAKGWTRQHVNAQVRRTKAVFRWGESHELVPPGKWWQLKSLAGLRKGKTTAPDQAKVVPVDDATVDATLPHLSPTVRAMVVFHRLTGCRPQDVCTITPVAIDRTGEVWVYRPAVHKTEWRGHDHTVYIGPQAQAVLLPFLDGEPTKPVFSPRRAWQERSDTRRATGKGSKANWVPVGPPASVRDQYDTGGYIKAIRRGCVRAGVAPWTPNQLRHAAGTDFRDKHGLDAAQELLGHKHASTTERYAQPKRSRAEAAAKSDG